MQEKNGEHPLRDVAQIALLVLFMGVWVLDSFLLHHSTELSEAVSLTVRMALAALVLVFASLVVWVGICTFYNIYHRAHQLLVEMVQPGAAAAQGHQQSAECGPASRADGGVHHIRRQRGAHSGAACDGEARRGGSLRGPAQGLLRHHVCAGGALPDSEERAWGIDFEGDGDVQ